VAGREELGVSWDYLACGWLSCLREHRDAPSWQIADRLASEGHVGILVPSFVPGATQANHNLILWQWGPDLPYRVIVYDPSGRLPQNQLSWPSKNLGSI
jgi:RES domain-containing protein